MKLASLILPLYFQVGLSFPASEQLDSNKQSVEYKIFKQSWLKARHDVSKDILELSARHLKTQTDKTRNSAKLLDKLQLQTNERNQRKLHRRKKSTGCVDFACFGDRAMSTTTTTTPMPPPINPALLSAATETSTETTTLSTEAQSIDTSKILWSPFHLRDIASKLKAIFSKAKFSLFSF